MRPIAHPAMAEVTLAGILHALGDPVRLALVRNLAATEELNCSAACGAMRLPKSTLSHHFRVLREAGLIRTRPEGTQAVNRLRRDELDRRFPGLLDAVLAADRPAEQAA